MAKKDSVGLTLGRPGQTHAVAVITIQDMRCSPEPYTRERRTKRIWRVAAVKRFQADRTIPQLSHAIVRLYKMYASNDPKRFNQVVVDAEYGCEAACEFRRLLPLAGITVRATPVVDGEGTGHAKDGNVRRQELLDRWKIAVERDAFEVRESLGLDWKGKMAKLDAGARWRQNHDDDLAAAIALAMWHATEADFRLIGAVQADPRLDLCGFSSSCEKL